MTEKLSVSGKNLVEEVRRQHPDRWGRQDARWRSSANVSLATLKRFWRGEPISPAFFIDICQAVGINNWQDVAIDEPDSSLALDYNFHIERFPMESQCYKQILQPGSLIRIKGTQRMGKTTLMEKILESAENQGCRSVILSMKLADKNHFSELDKFLRWFCANVSLELDLPSEVDNCWESDMGHKMSCTAYFQNYLLKPVNSPLVLGLDDLDLMFQHPKVCEDFFGLLRSWHEKAKTQELWKRLRLVVAHSTEVYIPLNIDQSPFNVGWLVELPDFNSEQVQKLSQLYGLNLNTNQVEQLMMMVEGNPHLIQQALFHLQTRQEIKINDLLKNASTEAGIYIHHLRQHLLVFREHPKLANAMKEVVTATASVRLDSIITYKLQSMGLVKLQGNKVKPYCNLYKEYFQDRL